MRTICYPTPLQEESVKSWLKNEITAVLSEGTDEKVFTFETTELELPFDLIYANCRIKSEVSINENYKNPQREIEATIAIQPVIGVDEGQEFVLFIDTKELENIKNYE